MKKIIFCAFALAATTLTTHAQSMKHTLKLGVIGGASLPQDNTVGQVGVTAAYQYLVTPHFGLGAASGFQYFPGRDNNNAIEGVNLNNNGVGVMPMAILLRAYPRVKGFYAGADFGYALLLGDEQVTSNWYPYNAARPDGGIYLKPEIGWHNPYWNIYLHYTKVVTSGNGEIRTGGGVQNYNIGALGIGVAYNLGLAK